ncbi:hypothetical protein Trydic_g19489 [Trypoxylus dichotomus]
MATKETKVAYLTLALICVIFNSRTSLAFEIGSSIGALARKLSNSNWDLIEDRSDLRANATLDRKQARIFRKVNKLSEAFRRLEQPLLSTSFVDVIIANTNNKMISDISKLLDRIEQVDYIFEQLAEYYSEDMNVYGESETVDASTLIDFSRMVTSHQATSVKYLTKLIHDVIAPPRKYRNSGLFKWLAETSVSIAICLYVHYCPY